MDTHNVDVDRRSACAQNMKRKKKKPMLHETRVQFTCLDHVQSIQSLVEPSWTLAGDNINIMWTVGHTDTESMNRPLYIPSECSFKEEEQETENIDKVFQLCCTQRTHLH